MLTNVFCPSGNETCHLARKDRTSIVNHQQTTSDYYCVNHSIVIFD